MTAATTYADTFRQTRALQEAEADLVNTMWRDRTGPLATEVAQAMRTAIIALADRWHAQYPQYAGHWNGTEWKLVRAKRTISTKGGTTFRKGDYLIAREQTPAETARYTQDRAFLGKNAPTMVFAQSLLTQSETSVPGNSVEWLHTV